MLVLLDMVEYTSKYLSFSYLLDVGVQIVLVQ